MLLNIKNLKCLAFVSLLMISACSSKTSYKSLDNTDLASSFSVQDQVNLVNQLSNNILSSNIIKNRVKNSTPKLLIDSIKNKTSEHIDTESITDTLQSNIISSGLFTIISRQNTHLLGREQILNKAGLTDASTAAHLGKLYGAEYVLYGNFSSIVNYVKKAKNTYYKLTLFLQNIETGAQLWIGEASVNKVTK